MHLCPGFFYLLLKKCSLFGIFRSLFYFAHSEQLISRRSDPRGASLAALEVGTCDVIKKKRDCNS